MFWQSPHTPSSQKPSSSYHLSFNQGTDHLFPSFCRLRRNVQTSLRERERENNSDSQLEVSGLPTNFFSPSAEQILLLLQQAPKPLLLLWRPLIWKWVIVGGAAGRRRGEQERGARSSEPCPWHISEPPPPLRDMIEETCSAVVTPLSDEVFLYLTTASSPLSPHQTHAPTTKTMLCFGSL